MNADQILDFLRQRSVTWVEETIDYGRRFRCPGGEVISAYDSGKVTVQGKPTALRTDLQRFAQGEATDALGAGAAEGAEGSAGVGTSKQVFIVYGHDEQSRKDLELLLHKMGMKPIVLAYETPGGDTIIEKLEKVLLENPQVRFACVLLTPDDMGFPVGAPPEQAQYRARQNVILELGMVLGHLGRKRVAIFHKQSVELPSDIHGVLYIGYKERIDEEASLLYRILSEAGYSPDKGGL